MYFFDKIFLRMYLKKNYFDEKIGKNKFSYFVALFYQ